MMTMPAMGTVSLGLALLTAVYVFVAGILAHWRHHWRLLESVRGAAVATALCLTMAVFSLEYLLMAGDYAIRAVYNHSDQTLPLAYKMGALWGGDSGSVLFWGWILSLYVAYIAWRGFESVNHRVTALALPLLGGELTFFAAVSLWAVNPFATVLGEPSNGVGLDPLLRNPVMIIHPPAMYTGLVGLSIPAIYMASGLWQRLPWVNWLFVFRRWLLFAWMCLGGALILGGMWAYLELGWGGYWEWDPVENAALLPWLAATACLHALQLVERRQVYRVWTAVLGVSAFLLTLVGTYITRSGVLKNSVHSFIGTGVGPCFVLLFWMAAVGMAALLWLRRDTLVAPTPARPVSEGAREVGYRALLEALSAVTAIVLFGTFFPVVSKAFFHQTVVLTKGFFNNATTPIFIFIVGLLGVVPTLGWARSVDGRTMRNLIGPMGCGIGVALFVYARGYRNWASILGMATTGFALTSVSYQLYHRLRKIPGLALMTTVFRQALLERRRFGGYVAHLAFLIVVMGVIGSHTNAASITQVVHPGEVLVVDGYHVRYQGLKTTSYAGEIRTGARLRVSDGHRTWIERPAMSFFDGVAQPVADVSVHQGIMQNLYLVLEATTARGGAMLEVMVNPMVSWIWIALPILLVGSLLAIASPDPRSRRARLLDQQHMSVGLSSGMAGRDPS